jgi:hypothetical protein
LFWRLFDPYNSLILTNNSPTPTLPSTTQTTRNSSRRFRNSQTNITSYFGARDPPSSAQPVSLDSHIAHTSQPQSTPTSPVHLDDNSSYPNAYDECTTPNTYIGDPPLSPKPPPFVLRVYMCNPNGLQLHSSGGDFTEPLTQIADTESDIIGVTEHNLDTTKQHVQLCMRSAIRSVFDRSHLAICSSTIPSVHDFKPGGTLLAAQGNITGRIVNSGTDPIGRWAFVELAGKQHRNVVIIIAYQVCDQSFITNNTIKSLTASSQQSSILRQQDRTCTPQEAFISDLTSVIKSIQQRNHGVLLLGDFNEPLSLDHRGMTGLAIDCNLTDVMLRLHDDDSFPTYIRGQSRIDYILASDWV